MRNTTLFIIMAVIIALIVGFVLSDSTSLNNGYNAKGNSKSPISNTGNGEVQIVKLNVQNSNYILTPSEVKKGIAVRIEADMSNMPGCSKSIVIPGFEISKTFTASDNTVEFTPDKAGTFNIACSMNMYKGTFTVLEADGKQSNYVESKSASSGSTGGTCGMSSGGSCGCGM